MPAPESNLPQGETEIALIGPVDDVIVESDFFGPPHTPLIDRLRKMFPKIDRGGDFFQMSIYKPVTTGCFSVPEEGLLPIDIEHFHI